MSKAENIKSSDVPTMEEILSSIRSIIEEENETQPSKGEDSRAMSNNQNSIDSMFDAVEPVPAQTAPAPTSDADDIMELTEVVENGAELVAKDMSPKPEIIDDFDAVPVQQPEIEQAGDPSCDIEIDIDAPEIDIPAPVMQEEVHVEAPKPAPVSSKSAPSAGLDSGLTSELSVDASARSLSQISDLVGGVNSVPLGGAKTLEQLTKDLLEPHLKAWLDDNLPHITENLVRQEINRLVSRLEKRK